MRRLWGCVAMLWLIAFGGCAAAEEVFVIPANEVQFSRLEDGDYLNSALTAATQYIQITCDLGDQNQEVTLSVHRQTDGKVVHQKNYGVRSGKFRSDEIYLKYSGSETVKYTITLQAGAQQWQFPFYRKLMALSHNTACSYGVRIREAAPGVTKSWPMATVVDLRGGSHSVPLCASNQYIIGTVNISVSADSLSVQVTPRENIDLTIHNQRVYAITDPGTLTSLDGSALGGQVSFKPGQKISISKDLGGSQYVILYLAMEVSYDPNGLESFSYDPGSVSDQLSMWRQLQQQSGVEAVG
ncbi:MAG: hypothetical protein IJ461_02745 [Clostridia bacterium]|nr:hypothetical protein [Clostridia bacterium]